VSTAARIMTESLRGVAGRQQRWVYDRAGRPCRRCRSLISARRQGEQSRTAYWCPSCQPL
jgi:endonuclease-8